MLDTLALLLIALALFLAPDEDRIAIDMLSTDGAGSAQTLVAERTESGFRVGLWRDGTLHQPQTFDRVQGKPQFVFSAEGVSEQPLVLDLGPGVAGLKRFAKQPRQTVTLEGESIVLLRSGEVTQVVVAGRQQVLSVHEHEEPDDDDDDDDDGDGDGDD